MARLVFGMNQSLDGYVDHMRFAPDPALFQHFVEQAREQTGAIYGRGLYELMRYWDEDDAGWSAAEHDFARAWRAQQEQRRRRQLLMMARVVEAAPSGPAAAPRQPQPPCPGLHAAWLFPLSLCVRACVRA